MFGTSYACMVIGIMLNFLAFIMSYLFPVMFLWLIVFGLGIIFIMFSLIRIHIDVTDSTLINLINAPKRGMVNWLFVYNDGEIIVTEAMRKVEKFSQSAKLDQQVKEWKTYRFAGHTVRIVGDGTGFSIDLGACAKVTQLKRDYGIRNIFHIRKVFRPNLNEIPDEGASTLEDAQIEAGMKPIQPGGSK